MEEGMDYGYIIKGRLELREMDGAVIRLGRGGFGMAEWAE